MIISFSKIVSQPITMQIKASTVRSICTGGKKITSMTVIGVIFLLAGGIADIMSYSISSIATSYLMSCVRVRAMLSAVLVSWLV